MKTIASEFVSILSKHGVRVEVNNDRLRFHPREKLTDDVVVILKRHKTAILEHLRVSASAQFDNPAENGNCADADNETLNRIHLGEELVPDDVLSDWNQK